MRETRLEADARKYCWDVAAARRESERGACVDSGHAGTIFAQRAMCQSPNNNTCRSDWIYVHNAPRINCIRAIEAEIQHYSAGPSAVPSLPLVNPPDKSILAGCESRRIRVHLTVMHLEFAEPRGPTSSRSSRLNLDASQLT